MKNPFIASLIKARGEQFHEVWPENWPVFILFTDIQTQWRTSSTGLIGLDYNVLFRKLDRMNLPPQQYDEIESDIRVMEFAALATLNKKEE